MAYHYIFDPIAADEYEEAFTWYEQKSAMAADNLLLAVQDAIVAICNDPHRYRNNYKNLRELTIKRYPYNLIYHTDDKKMVITIVSLYHHKRDPLGKYVKSKK